MFNSFIEASKNIEYVIENVKDGQKVKD
jgi:hypothetical protein